MAFAVVEWGYRCPMSSAFNCIDMIELDKKMRLAGLYEPRKSKRSWRALRWPKGEGIATGKRKPRGFFLNRKPQTKPCMERYKPPKPTVHLTESAIYAMGGIAKAAKNVARVLGYPVEIKVVKDLDPDKNPEGAELLSKLGQIIKGTGAPPSLVPSPSIMCDCKTCEWTDICAATDECRKIGGERDNEPM